MPNSLLVSSNPLRHRSSKYGKHRPGLRELTDLELAERIAQCDALAVRIVSRRNNQRLYRVAWSILKDRADAEDAVQEGYLKAFGAIDTFAGASSLSTWLTRIVLNEALGLRRSAERKIQQLREQSIALIEDYRENVMGAAGRLFQARFFGAPSASGYESCRGHQLR